MTDCIVPLSARLFGAVRTRTNRIGPLVLTWLCLSGCRNSTGAEHRDAIRRVRAEMAVAATQQNLQARIATLKAIDLAGAPNEFKACYEIHLDFLEHGNAPGPVSGTLVALDEIACKYGAIARSEVRHLAESTDAEDSD